VNSNCLKGLGSSVFVVACTVMPRKEDTTVVFLNQLLETIKFPGVIVPDPWKACNVWSTHANIVPMQLLDQEATPKFNASNRIRESFCENPVCIFDVISTSTAVN
jgi:hypothetical protein